MVLHLHLREVPVIHLASVARVVRSLGYSFLDRTFVSAGCKQGLLYVVLEDGLAFELEPVCLCPLVWVCALASVLARVDLFKVSHFTGGW